MSVALYLGHLHELPDLGHSGQEPLVDLQGLLTVTLLHLEIFLCTQHEKHIMIILPQTITELLKASRYCG